MSTSKEQKCRVFLDLTANDESIGRLVFELNTTLCPKTSENFRVLCSGEAGFGYKGCVFYRVIPTFCACVISRRTTPRGVAVARYMRRSSLTTRILISHTIPEACFPWTTMAGQTPTPPDFSSPSTNANGLISKMDNYHVAFGKLIDGFTVLDTLEGLGTIEGHGVQKGRTTKVVKISNCGQLS